MKFAYPEITEVFDTENGMYNSVIIENKRLFTDIITDLYNQKDGFEGKTVISENHVPIQISKKVDIIDKFIPFQLNTKSIVNGIASALEKCAVNEENISRTLSLIAQTESFLLDLAFEFPCSISFDNISISSIIKYSGINVESELNSISEKVCEYMELVTEFEKRKMFVTVNMRSFVEYDEMEKFAETAIMHGYDIIAIENCAYKKLKNESRLIIDEDLCEIMC